jgi:HEAT repeat protein
LRHPFWEVRNIGVKAAGIGKLDEAKTLLLEILSCPAERGFIRRNAAYSLSQLVDNDGKIKKCLIQSLRDSYYEVRMQSALSLAECEGPDETLESLFVELIFKVNPGEIINYPIWFPGRIYHEKNFEVRAAYTIALGKFVTSKYSLHALELLLHDCFWKVREAAMQGYYHAALRMQLDENTIQSVLKELDLTCTDFRPVFPIRRTWNETITLIQQPGNKAGSERR